MYTTTLTLHSWLRWAALLAGVAATLAALTDRGTATSSARADRSALVLMVALDLQMLLGLLLYLVLSPFTKIALQDFGAAMHNPLLRFWAVEHASMMFLAVILAHVGRVLARTASTPAARRTRRLVFVGLATVAMFAAIPWPGMANGRPLIRL